MNSGELHQLLRDRYAAPEYALLPEVRNGTGYSRTTRYADAIAVSCYPSRGIHLYGFEIKVSRGDWTRELKAPAKAEEMAAYCDFWFIVAPDGVVKLDEMPANWGLLVPDKAKLKVAKPAVKLDPRPVTKELLASILRNAMDSVVPKSDMSALVEAKARQRVAEVEKSAEAMAKLRHEGDARTLATLQNALNEFEQRSGIKIDQWNAGRIGQAVNIFLRMQQDPTAAMYLQRAEQTFKNLQTEVASVLAAITPAAEKETPCETKQTLKF